MLLDRFWDELEINSRPSSSTATTANLIEGRASRLVGASRLSGFGQQLLFGNRANHPITLSEANGCRARVRRPRQRLGRVAGFGRGIALELNLLEAARTLEDRFDAFTFEVQLEQKRCFEDSA